MATLRCSIYVLGLPEGVWYNGSENPKLIFQRNDWNQTLKACGDQGLQKQSVYFRVAFQQHDLSGPLPRSMWTPPSELISYNRFVKTSVPFPSCCGSHRSDLDPVPNQNVFTGSLYQKRSYDITVCVSTPF